ncbi:hypothetical protein T484DRAFT_1879398 [Baffinella frigidus]|nr:hypothetical protein T484DRAFT_1879398 [Cryptophyta sp. CCMP2293]
MAPRTPESGGLQGKNVTSNSTELKSILGRELKSMLGRVRDRTARDGLKDELNSLKATQQKEDAGAHLISLKLVNARVTGHADAEANCPR